MTGQLVALSYSLASFLQLFYDSPNISNTIFQRRRRMTEPELLQLIERAKREGWTELDLSGQDLTSLPYELSELFQLRVLKLGWNRRTRRRNNLTQLPGWIGQLTNLQSLSLNNNSLTTLPKELEQLINLNSLALSYNKLIEVPQCIAMLSSLRSLFLSGNKLTLLSEWVKRLTNLQSLSLSYNNLSELPNWLTQLTNLQSLDLSHNNLSELPQEITKLLMLESLSLSRNKLTTLPNWIGQFSNLRSLLISYNKLTKLPDEIATLAKLQTLDISNNNVVTLQDCLVQIASLCSLTLSYNNIKVLPQFIAELVNLQSLLLRGNSLGSLPEWMAQLTNLQSLDIGNTNITVLPQWISQLTNLQSLNVCGNNLTVLPEWMSQLTNLLSLDISNNKISVLPAWIDHLTNLESLSVCQNKITSLPKEMAKLNNLQFLDLRKNKLTALPEWMAQLTNLRSLIASRNKLEVLPEWIARLTNLHLLNLRSNNLIELPQGLAQLANLYSLDLRKNCLTTLPKWMATFSSLQSLYLSENQIAALPEWMADSDNLPQLQNLWLGKNPITIPPPELLGTALLEDYKNADIATIRSYFQQLLEAKSIYFYEAKLLIIGEGGAGKTSLANKLINPEYQLSKEEKSTEGIDVLTWKFPLPPQVADDDYLINIWDFGGQEIYFATHQFFLTRRSVYLLVADTRRQHTDFYNWLRMQETFGGDSAVLLVKNRNRQLGNSFTIENLPQLRERFPNLKETIELDLNEVPDSPSWTDLLHHLKEYLLRLDHIGQPRPATWVAVRQAIDSESRDVITWNEFLTLCQAQGMKREEDIQLLGEYLHNLGDILYFHEDAVLCDYVILKPTWGLDAVYKVLDNPQIIEQLGQFNRKDLRQLWNDAKYQGYQTQLLRLMENFQLCYPLAEVKDTYIAPQLLTEDPPNYDWDSSENLQLRYVYPVFMPRGILSRAIVKLHQRIETQRLVWRSGAILSDGYARAEVLELRGDQQIRIRVSGRNKRDLLMEIVRALDELHLGFPKLRFERRIPCNCESCQQRSEPHFYALERLQERLANRKDTIECQLPPYNEVTIREMLDEFGDLRGRGRKRGEIWDRIDELQTHSIVINEINTGGGHYVGGDVDAGGDFVGRDKS